MCCHTVRRIAWATALVCVLACQADASGPVSVDDLKSRITQAAVKLKDVSFTFTVIEKNADAIEKVDSNYARLYDFKSARVSLKEPDKLRTDGKLGMVKFEYIVNAGLKIVRAPMLKIKREKSYAGNPGKLNDALDFGILAPSLWAMRKIEILKDPAATAADQTKIGLSWDSSGTRMMVWIDNKDTCIKRVERYDGDCNLKVVLVYTNFKKPDGVAWIPTRIESFGEDGCKLGVCEISDIKVNAGLQDSLFK
jgi:outer membrane lipoprotein-sorting protein